MGVAVVEIRKLLGGGPLNSEVKFWTPWSFRFSRYWLNLYLRMLAAKAFDEPW